MALGLLTPLAALAICGAMLVAILMVHLPNGFFSQKGCYEFPLTLLGAALAIGLLGSGRYALDTMLNVRVLPAASLEMAVLVVLGAAVAVAGARLGLRRAQRQLG